jgi:hypothetical protein
MTKPNTAVAYSEPELNECLGQMQQKIVNMTKKLDKYIQGNGSSDKLKTKSRQTLKKIAK